MSLKYGALSLIVLGVVLFLVFENYEIWTQPIKLFPKTQKEKIKPVEKKNESLSATLLENDILSKQSHISIAEKNIFNPDRKEFPILGKEIEPLAPPPVRPQVILYGVTITEDYQVASIANPGRPLHKGERETFPIKLGEKVGEYKVAKIFSDRITLEREGDNFEVLLFDPSRPKKRIEAKTETKPATITSISTQPGPTAQAPSTPTSSTSSTPLVSAQASKTSPPPVSSQDLKTSLPPSSVTSSSSSSVTFSPPSAATPTPTSTRTPTAYPRPGPEIRWGTGPYHK